MFLPGAPCSCCGGGCNPLCPTLSADCVTLSFSGFANGTSICNECDYLDDLTLVLKRPASQNVSISASVSDASGAGAVLSVTLSQNALDNTFFISSVSVVSGGSGYTPDAKFSYALGGAVVACNGEPEVALTVSDGVVTAAIITNGGRFWRNSGCSYSTVICATCPTNNGKLLRFTFTAGTPSHSLLVEIGTGGGGYSTLLSATKQHDGSPLSDLEFGPESFSEQYRCVTTGTATVTPTACTEISESYCGPPPQQISLSISGIPTLYKYGGFPQIDWSQPFGGACGESSGENTPRYGTFNIDYPYGQVPASRPQEIILDRSDIVYGSCTYRYRGFIKAPRQSFNSVQCERASTVDVHVDPIQLFSSVSIAPPTNAGFAASAEITAINAGKISAIAVTNGGAGYARELFETVAPTVSASCESPGGTDAAFSVSLVARGVGTASPYWQVQSVSVASGGTGYEGDEPIVFSVAEGDSASLHAAARVIVGKGPPDISAAASPGTGASFTVNTVSNGDGTWSVSGVSVSGTTSGYADGDELDFSTDDVEVSAATAVIRTTRLIPSISLSVPCCGTGAQLSATLVQGVSWYDGGAIWSISSISITNAGTGYSPLESVAISLGSGVESDPYSYFDAYVSEVGENGEILAIEIYGPGGYYIPDPSGAIASVSVSAGGSYYKALNEGEVGAVVVDDGGYYFRYQSTGTSAVDNPAVTIYSTTGTGAQASAVVDGTLGSATFGKVTAITVTAGGQNYKLGGTGWKLSVYVENLSHRATDGCLVPTYGLFAFGCQQSTQCTWLQGYREPLSERVTEELCPTSLLNKSYKMLFMEISVRERDNFDFQHCVAPWTFTTGYLVVADFGQGDIECEISVV